MEANEGNPNPYDLIASFTRVCRIRLLPDYIDIAKILHIYLDSPLVKSRLMKVAESSYKSAISGDVVRNLSIPLPPPEVRKRIQDMYVNAYELDFSLFYGLQDVDNWNNLLKQLITGMIYKGKS
jgi:hypothetical protein